MTVVNVGRRRRKGVNDLQLAANTDVHFHPEMPLISSHRLMDFGVMLFGGVLGRPRQRDDRSIDDRATPKPLSRFRQGGR